MPYTERPDSAQQVGHQGNKTVSGGGKREPLSEIFEHLMHAGPEPVLWFTGGHPIEGIGATPIRERVQRLRGSVANSRLGMVEGLDQQEQARIVARSMVDAAQQFQRLGQHIGINPRIVYPAPEDVDQRNTLPLYQLRECLREGVLHPGLEPHRTGIPEEVIQRRDKMGRRMAGVGPGRNSSECTRFGA